MLHYSTQHVGKQQQQQFRMLYFFPIGGKSLKELSLRNAAGSEIASKAGLSGKEEKRGSFDSCYYNSYWLFKNERINCSAVSAEKKEKVPEFWPFFCGFSFLQIFGNIRLFNRKRKRGRNTRQKKVFFPFEDVVEEKRDRRMWATLTCDSPLMTSSPARFFSRTAEQKKKKVLVIVLLI